MSFWVFVFQFEFSLCWSTCSGWFRLNWWQDANLISAQSAKDDSAIVPFLNDKFEILVDCKVDVEMYPKPSTPHDRDVMSKVQGVHPYRAQFQGGKMDLWWMAVSRVEYPHCGRFVHLFVAY